MKRNGFFSRLLEVTMFIFLYAPIVVLIVFSFNSSKSRSVWTGFSLEWYEKLLSNDLVLNSFYVTIAVAVLSSLIATVLGTAAAIGISNMRRGPRSLALVVNNIPITNPDIITGVSLMLLFGIFASLTNIRPGFLTLLLAHITFNIPYVILSVMPRLRSLNKHIYEAALDLGAHPALAFRRVIFPEILPGIINGLMIAFTMSIDDFVISYFTSGPDAQTLAMTIFSMTKKRVSPEINALSSIMFGGVLLLLLIINLRRISEHKTKIPARTPKSFLK